MTKNRFKEVVINFSTSENFKRKSLKLIFIKKNFYFSYYSSFIIIQLIFPIKFVYSIKKQFIIKRDIKKAINYYSLAANNYSIEALLNLGSIFLTIIRNINKAIYYFSLAAKREIIVPIII